MYVHFIALCVIMKLCTTPQEKGEGESRSFTMQLPVLEPRLFVKHSSFDPAAGLSPFVGRT